MWQNWSQDLIHRPSVSGAFHYFSPTNVDELRTIVLQAKAAGVTLRVSGQRHSQPALVADDNRDAPPNLPKTWLVDLSCYADLGMNGDQQMVADFPNKTVTVNAGVREDYLDAFLTTKNLMFKTVTAGGFFSIGGITAVDVNGATVAEPIFAETASAYTIMGPDGVVRTIRATDPPVNGWKPIQFSRVSLGAIGVVTSVTLDVLDRPWATSVSSSSEHYVLADEDAFVAKYKGLIADYERIESFYDPYNDDFFVLLWKLEPTPSDETPNATVNEVASSCTFAELDLIGAPYEGKVAERLAQNTTGWAQYSAQTTEAQIVVQIAFAEVKRLFDRAACDPIGIWLTRAVFMSYFVEMLLKVFDGSTAV